MQHQGPHFLQIPGPSPVPDRVLRAMDRQVIDHRGPAFAVLGKEVLAGIKTLFQTTQPVIIYPSSGTGAWEAAIVNVLAAGDKVLMVETGHFAALWKKMAERFQIEVDYIPGDWRHGCDPAQIEAKLVEDKGHKIKAVMVVHNETSTGALSNIPNIRKAIDNANHPALLLVDAISSLGSAEYKHDEWGADVTVTSSQKGLMLPPGLGFNAVSEKAFAAARANKTPRSYWDWEDMLAPNAAGYFPSTPATNLLWGLREVIAMIHEEGLDNLFARHQKMAAATRKAVEAWGLEIVCLDKPNYSPILTGVMMPPGHNADAFRKIALDNFNISLGMGLGKLGGKAFRIGHLGDINPLMLIGALGGVEMGLSMAGVPFRAGGVQAAMRALEEDRPGNALKA